MAVHAKNIHADATHKVTSEKLPLIVLGSTDMNRVFHLIGFTITSNETAKDYEFTFNSLRHGVQKITNQEIEPEALVADADRAIHKGYRDSFQNPDALIIMCYAHVMSNVERKYRFNDKANKEGILKDLRILHNAADERSFKAGCELFVTKWNEKESESVGKIQKSFFKSNSNWFIGAYHRVPKTNNALERFNGSVKIFQTQYQQKPLKQFQQIAMKIIQQRSKQYKADKEPFQGELQISTHLMQKGIAYAKDVIHKEKENGEIEFFVFRSGIDQEITQEIVEEFQKTVYPTFDEFAKKSFDIWKITFQADPAKWKNATCTCPSFDADYMCKHIIGIGHQIGIIEEPPADNYDDEPLFKSTKGRPKRATEALRMD